MSANGPSVFEQTKKFFAIFSSCKFESVGYVYLKQHNYLNVSYQNYDNKKFRIFFRVFRSVIFADKGNFREISRWPLFVNEQNDQNHNVLHYEFALLLTREKLGQPARLNKLHQNQNRPALILEHLFFTSFAPNFHDKLTTLFDYLNTASVLVWAEKTCVRSSHFERSKRHCWANFYIYPVLVTTYTLILITSYPIYYFRKKVKVENKTLKKCI